MSARLDPLGSVYKYRDAQGREHFNAEIYADETSDISGQTVFEGTKVADPNSTAYVIKTGKLYVMGSDNKWYDSADGSEVQ